MPFKGVADRKTRSVLFTSLQDYCGEFEIKRNSAAYFQAGKVAMRLFAERFVTADALLTGLKQTQTSEFERANTFELGQRVFSHLKAELGTVVEVASAEIKVNWDSGATSYFKQGKDSDVLHAPRDGEATEKPD